MHIISHLITDSCIIVEPYMLVLMAAFVQAWLCACVDVHPMHAWDPYLWRPGLQQARLHGKTRVPRSKGFKA